MRTKVNKISYQFSSKRVIHGKGLDRGANTLDISRANRALPFELQLFDCIQSTQIRKNTGRSLTLAFTPIKSN